VSSRLAFHGAAGDGMTDRKRHWEQVYATKSPLEVSWYQTEPKLSLDLIAGAGLAHDAPVIDVGGGASVLVDRLLGRGYSRVAVLDISGKALGAARERLGARARDVEWHEADVTEFQPPHAFALWHDRAVFHFLTDAEDRRRYVATMKRALEPDGHVIIASFAIGGPTRCSNLDIVQYDAAKLGAELGGEFVLREEMSEVHVTPAAKEQKFGFFRFQRKR
jgi:SAM-dependent methyltransferase